MIHISGGVQSDFCMVADPGQHPSGYWIGDGCFFRLRCKRVEGTGNAQGPDEPDRRCFRRISDAYADDRLGLRPDDP